MIIRPWRTQRDRPEGQVTEWEVDTAGERDSFGRPLPRRRWKVTGSKAKATAIGKTRIAALIRGDSESREPESDRPITLRTYVEKYYIPWAQETHSVSTWKNRECDLRVHVLPKWGDLPLTKVQTPETLADIRRYLLDDSQHPTGRGLRKNSSRNQILISLSAVLGHAADPETAPSGVPLIHKLRIRRLPQDHDETPTDEIGDFGGVGRMRNRRIPKDKVETLNIAASQHREPELAVVLVKLGLKAGLRAGEMAGLRWDDIHFEKAVLKVARAVCPRSETIKTTKTGRVATLPIEGSLLEALNKLREKSESEYVLGTKDGYRTSRELRELYSEITTSAWGTPDRKLHALRHTYASDLADSGLPVHSVKRLCRHASVKTTFSYMHPGDGMFEEARAALSDGAVCASGSTSDVESLRSQVLLLQEALAKRDAQLDALLTRLSAMT